MTQPFEQWFERRGWTPFGFQRQTWRAFLEGRSGLVHAPTGMGKTHAVWGGPVSEALAAGAAARESIEPLRVLWITPLRALANDTVENLREPVADLDLPWTIELRTGDSSQAQRVRQRKRLPTALVTTPESLSLLLSYAGASKRFETLRSIIVDEWHELMGNKRGVQTELCLARLRSIVPAARTWGLSATLGNTEQAMHVLLGPAGAKGGLLISGDVTKETVVETIRPEDAQRFPWAGHLGTRLLPRVIEAIEQGGTTLMFTNTRSQTELWFQAILRARPDLIGHVALHYGSLDRRVRTEVEHLLRRGALKCVVCTSSLDLGVDFTPVDQVIQIGSPKGVARMMQRAGRSGHQPGEVSRIIGVPTHALELMEFSAARTAVAQKRIEDRAPVVRPLDVLAQHLVTVALGDGFEEEAMREEVRRTHAYAGLTDDEWQWTMDFITRGGQTLAAYPQFSKVVHEGGRCVVTSRRLGRLHRMMVGTITSDASMKVRYVGGRTLGTIEETFISRLRPGDRFVFAGRVVELARVRDMTAHVRRTKGGKGVVPRWMGGRSPLSTELAHAVRGKLDGAKGEVFDDDEMALIRPLLELQRRWSIIPATDELLIEITSYRGLHHAYVFTLAGRLVNEGLSALVAYRLTRGEPSSINVTGNDYGFELMGRDPFDLDQERWRAVLSTDRLLEDLLECVNASELARRSFRDIARIAGLIFPGYPGQPKPTRHLQASSDLFFEVFREFDPSNRLLDQARREVLERELEVSRLRATLDRIARQAIVIVPTTRFTPLAFPLWAERMRSQHISSERWQDRIERMAVTLERAAEAEARRRTTKHDRRVGV